MRNRSFMTQAKSLKQAMRKLHGDIDGFDFVLDVDADTFTPWSFEAIRSAGFRCRESSVKGFFEVEDERGYQEYLDGLESLSEHSYYSEWEQLQEFNQSKGD